MADVLGDVLRPLLTDSETTRIAWVGISADAGRVRSFSLRYYGDSDVFPLPVRSLVLVRKGDLVVVVAPRGVDGVICQIGETYLLALNKDRVVPVSLDIGDAFAWTITSPGEVL